MTSPSLTLHGQVVIAQLRAADTLLRDSGFPSTAQRLRDIADELVTEPSVYSSAPQFVLWPHDDELWTLRGDGLYGSLDGRRMCLWTFSARWPRSRTPVSQHTGSTTTRKTRCRSDEHDLEVPPRHHRRHDRHRYVVRWPSIKDGRDRFMTDAHILEAIEIEAVAAVAAPGPRPSGLSPRSRSKRAS